MCPLSCVHMLYSSSMYTGVNACCPLCVSRSVYTYCFLLSSQCSFLFCLLSNSCSSLHSSVYVTNHFMIVYKSSLSGCACAHQIILNSASLTVQFVYMCRVNGVGPTVTNSRVYLNSNRDSSSIFSGAGQHLYSNGHPMHALTHPNYKSMPLRAHVYSYII